jgi:IS30 family transposase
VCSGKNGTGGLLSIRDRKTRKHFYMRIRNLQSKQVLGCLRVFFLQLPPHLRKSLTLDNGSEFAYSEMKKLEQYFKELKVYYCDAYQSWQKGTVEQGHRKLRWYFPKGTDFSTVSFAEIKRVENLINNKPAKCLGYRKPADVFEQSLHQLDSELSQLKLAA